MLYKPGIFIILVNKYVLDSPKVEIIKFACFAQPWKINKKKDKYRNIHLVMMLNTVHFSNWKNIIK